MKRLLVVLITINFMSLLSMTPEALIRIQKREQAEGDFRELYKNLDIPPFNPHEQFGYSHYDVEKHLTLFEGNILRRIYNECFVAPFLAYSPTILKQYETKHFILLHEIGHYELSKKLPITYIAPISLMSGIIGMGFCKVPHKNRFIQLGLKPFAGVCIASFTFLFLARAHEVYADGFACKHVKNKEALQEVIQDLKQMQQEQNENFSQRNIPRVLYPMYRLYYDPIHPSIASRIKTMENTLEKRFNVKT